MSINSPDDAAWFVGASFGGTDDQTKRFLLEGIWEISNPSDNERDIVTTMRAQERIAIKAAYTRRHDLPFDNQQQPVSVMAIKATGVIVENTGDGHRVRVKWEPEHQPREWYFYTFRPTVWRVLPKDWRSEALIAFCFARAPQDYARFMADSRRAKSVLGPTQADRHGPSSESKRSTEMVPVTDYPGFGIPLLRTLLSGPRRRSELKKETLEQLKDKLMPGDLRLMPRGPSVAFYRMGWSLNTLKERGEVRSAGRSAWEITELGRTRVAHEENTWSLVSYQQTSRSRVLVAGLPSPNESRAVEGGGKPNTTWEDIDKLLPEVAKKAIHARLRLDLGPSPSAPIARNLLFYGPPGTGKTFIAEQVARAIVQESEGDQDSRVDILQFHPSYAYEDFILGFRPDIKSSILNYTLHKGPFFKMCRRARQRPHEMFVLVIDEFNRGDPARIFGELMYGIEYRGKTVRLAAGLRLVVPTNLVILCTMNSTDRSVALVDHALRRRFASIRLYPDPLLIRKYHPEGPAVERATAALEALNRWLVDRMGDDHAIGHAFFLANAIKPLDDRALDHIWNFDVKPLLEEVLYGDVKALKAATDCWQAATQS